jgi:hypothetical protein
LARVKTPEDRPELLEMHRIWGRSVEKAAKRFPLRRPAARPDNGKVRVGFMSSDLRNHPVAYFAMPLFEHLDRSRFEVFCYSYYQGDKADGTQEWIAGKVDGFRWVKDINDHDAAQMIADDQLDLLIELGGSTHMNKLGVMAYKPRAAAGELAGLSALGRNRGDRPSDPRPLRRAAQSGPARRRSAADAEELDRDGRARLPGTSDHRGHA